MKISSRERYLRRVLMTHKLNLYIYIYTVGQKSIEPPRFCLLQRLYSSNPLRKVESCETYVSWRNLFAISNRSIRRRQTTHFEIEKHFLQKVIKFSRRIDR